LKPEQGNAFNGNLLINKEGKVSANETFTLKPQRHCIKIVKPSSGFKTSLSIMENPLMLNMI
jgi:hypothetical protein